MFPSFFRGFATDPWRLWSRSGGLGARSRLVSYFRVGGTSVMQETDPLLPRFAIAQVQALSPAALAYIGDAVYELQVRTRYLFPARRIQDYHAQVVARVRAESQAEQLRSLQSHLTAAELEMVRRGRNSASKGPRRVDLSVYQQATGLETLLGYLYLTDPARLAEILNLLFLDF